MKQNNLWANTRTLWNCVLLMLFVLLSTHPVGAAIKVKAPPSIGMPGAKMSTRYGNSNSSNKARGNKKYAIYADGHPVLIEACGAETKITINGESLIQDLSYVYIYGGSEDADVTGNISITMNGGTVAGIFGGGYACDHSAIVNGSVEININGGSVGLVDGGGDDYDESYSSAVTGSSKVFLKNNVKYTGKHYINDNYHNHIYGRTSVFDFSQHTYDPNGVEWGTSSVAHSYIIQKGPGEWEILMRGERFIIPQGCYINAQKLKVDRSDNGSILNYGSVSVNPCGGPGTYIGPYINLMWSGNPIKREHTPVGSALSKNESGHTRICSICKEEVQEAHSYVYKESSDTDIYHASHSMICSVCNYTKTESCTKGYQQEDNTKHSVICTSCKHIFSSEDHHRTYAFQEVPFNDLKHISECTYCKAQYTVAHSWTHSENPECSLCHTTNHTHQYENGTCKTCSYYHEDHDYKVDDRTGNSVCKVCGSGCNHSYVVGGVTYGISQIGTFPNEKSMTSAGHYLQCPLCDQYIYEGPHTLEFDNQTGSYKCNRWKCEYGCAHAEEDLKHRTVSNYRQELTPEGYRSYSVVHDETSCKKCGNSLSCYVSDSEGQIRGYMVTLEEAFEYIRRNHLDNAKVTMTNNQTYFTPLVIDLWNIHVTLDLNDCDLSFMKILEGSSAVSVVHGDLSIINSKYSQTYNFAQIYSSNSDATVKASYSAHVSVEGVSLSHMDLGRFNIRVGRAAADYVKLYDNNDDLIQITDTLTVSRWISGWNGTVNSLDLSTALPEGYVIAEKIAGEEVTVWNTLFDHQDKYFRVTGSLYGKGWVAILPCGNHELTTGTSQGTEGHNGSCIHCRQAVSGDAHQMTKAGTEFDSQYHHLSCAICGYESDEELEAHTFNSSTGRCTNDHCNAEASIALSLEGIDSKFYFATLEAAWGKTNRVGSIDTLTLLKDVTFTQPLTMSMTEADEEGEYGVPSILIQSVSDKLTLTYAGEGSPIIVNPAVADRSQIYLCRDLQISSNWASAGAAVRPMYGSVFNEQKDKIVACPQHDDEWAPETDGDGNVLPYHEATCKICGEKRDENHIYRDEDGMYHTECQKCHTSLIAVASTYDSNGTLISEYGSLKDAWYDAIAKSAERAEEITIQVVEDAVVERWNKYENNYNKTLYLDNADAKIVLVGGEHTVKTFDASLIYVTHGQLTVKSGIYRGEHHAIYRYENADAIVRLEGGTYLSGSGYRTNTDGICNEYHTVYGMISSEGIKQLITPGYILTVSELNHGDNFYKLQAGEKATIETPALTVSASGTITKCEHNNLSEIIPAKDNDCTHDGNIAYRYCSDCCSYIYNDEAENTIVTDRAGITVVAPGHDYEDGVCRVCGNLSKTVSVTFVSKEDPSKTIGTIGWIEGEEWDEKPFDSFMEAWNEVQNANLNFISAIVKIKLYDDITVSEYDYLDQRYGEKHIEIDLNGHNLNLDNQYVGFYDNGRNVSGSFSIKDSQKAGKEAHIGTLHFQGYYDLTIEDVIVHIHNQMDLFQSIALEGQSALVLYDSWETIEIPADFSMEPGCYIEGRGRKNFIISKDEDGTYDSHDAIANALHNASYYIADSQTGEYSPLTGEAHPTYTPEQMGYIGDCLNCTIMAPDGNEAGEGYMWRITEPEAGSVTHHSEAAPTDNGLTHGSPCIYCGMTSHEEHVYGDEHCILCGHEADVEVTVDGISTYYTVADSAFANLPDGAARIKLYNDCKVNEDWIIDSADMDYLLNLNDHKIIGMEGGFNFELSHGSLTIMDGPLNQGEIETSYYVDNNFNYRYKDFTVNCNPDVRLALLGGRISQCSIEGEGALNTVTSAKILLENFGFRVLSFDDDFDTSVFELMGDNCFMQDGYGDFITEDPSKTYFSGIRIFKGENLLSQNDNVNVEAPESISEETYPVVIEESLSNVTVRSFTNTGIIDAINIADMDLLNDLQNKVFEAGYSVIVNQNTASIKAYVEAELSAMTIVENVVDDNTVHSVTRMTFDVVPYLTAHIGEEEFRIKIDNRFLKEAIRFRLPVDPKLDVQYLEVYHTGADDVRSKCGNFEVETDPDQNEKYVEISSREFSRFDYLIVTDYVLTDANVFINRRENSTLNSVSYERTFASANEWEPLYIPMSITPKENCDIAEIFTFGAMSDTNGDGVIDEKDEIVLVVDKLEPTAVTEPNTPYLIRSSFVQEEGLTFESTDNTLYQSEVFVGSCSSTRTRYTFRGIYSAKDFTSNETAFTLEEGTVGTPSQSLVPQRWWVEATSKVGGYNQEIIQAQSSRIRVFAIGEDMDQETALKLLKGETIELYQDGKRYTLDGRLAVPSANSVQIINNKKVIEK